VTEEFSKPRYESPILIDLSSMAKGRGYCAAGPLDTSEYCTAGGSNPIACTDTGGAAQNECTMGVSATLACTAGPVSQHACTGGGNGA
jgi:hypothetical protein